MSTLQASLELYKKLPLPVSAETCTGKVYIVTGANTGLGLETARHLVAASAQRVIIAVRNVAAGEKAKAELGRSTGRKGVVIDVWPLDLSSFASVKAFAEKVATSERLDCLVANAGIMMDKWSTAEGMETCVTVNVISTLLLGVLMMPKLMESGRKFGGDKPCIVFVVSTLGFQSKKEMDKSAQGIVLDGLNDSQRANMDERYAVTKLVEIYAVREFAALCPVSRTGVVINMTAPGLCSTRLDRNARAWTQTWIAVARAMMARTPEQGSRPILHGVVAGQESHGKLLSGCKIKDYWVPDWVTGGDGPRLQKQIWKEISAKLDEAQPGCLSRIL